MKKVKIKKRYPSKRELLAKIRTNTDPILKAVCEICPKEKMDSLATEMISVLMATELGVGLAAPQIGVPLRAFALRQIVKNQGSCVTFFNPEYVEKSGELINRTEACLSYPGVVKSIDRHTWIVLKWEDEYGNEYTDKFVDFEARVIQHEMDHLDGICKLSNLLDDILRRKD